MNLTDQKFFFLGVGGMGMLPLALFVREGGAEVEGLDDGLTPRAETLLRSAGVRLWDSLPASTDCTVLVISSAIRPEHPVLQTVGAGENPPIILRRGELLAKLAETRRFIAVAGSHGKTTTTALLAHLAVREKWDADFVIGGLPERGLTPARNRGSEWLIAEVDESDGTIEGFSPEISVFLNFDWDHADRYRDPSAMQGAWSRLAERTTGTVIHPQTPAGALEPTWLPDRARVSFDDTAADFLERNGNAADLAFATATGSAPSSSALEGFPGVWRRQTFHARATDFAVVEDYAHHPREVSAFLSWLESQNLPQPLRVFFQPHRFSRTTRFVGEFVEALSGLDEVVLHSIYGAGENPGPGNNPLESIREGLEAGGVRVKRVERLGDFPPHSGTFAFIGAGDANEWAPILAAVEKSPTRVAALADLARRAIDLGTVREQEKLGPHTTMRIGGEAALWVAPGSIAELRWLLRTAHLLEVPVEFVGNGSNLLVSDEGFEGLVVHLGGNPWEGKQVSTDGTSVSVGAGTTMPGMARWAAGQGLEGFSFMEGIPGTIGGGLRMNAGSMGGWMGDLVQQIDAVDAAGRLVSFSRETLSFGYRSCPQLEGLCIIRAVFHICGTDRPENIREKMREFASRRRASQPGGPSAGCLFRNPEGDSAGRLIDAAGLKGQGIGKVRISEKHANFIQPESGAKAAEVVAVMKRARDEVRERFGVTLEPEVKFLGREGFRSIFSEEASRETERAR